MKAYIISFIYIGESNTRVQREYSRGASAAAVSSRFQNKYNNVIVLYVKGA